MTSVEEVCTGKPREMPVMKMDVQWIWMRSRKSWRKGRVVAAFFTATRVRSTEYHKLADDGPSETGRPTRERYRRGRGSKTEIENDVLPGATDKAPKEQLISSRCWTCKKVNFRRKTKYRRSSRQCSAASTTKCRTKTELSANSKGRLEKVSRS